MRRYSDLDQLDGLMATAPPPLEVAIALNKDRRKSESKMRTRLSLAANEVAIDDRYLLEEGGLMVGTY